MNAIKGALASHDRRTIEKYGRFLEPILEQIKAADPGRAGQIERDLERTYNSGMTQPQAGK
jgi:hypothetical protein